MYTNFSTNKKIDAMRKGNNSDALANSIQENLLCLDNQNQTIAEAGQAIGLTEEEIQTVFGGDQDTSIIIELY